jgi:hypothetical protein
LPEQCTQTDSRERTCPYAQAARGPRARTAPPRPANGSIRALLLRHRSLAKAGTLVHVSDVVRTRTLLAGHRHARSTALAPSRQGQQPHIGCAIARLRTRALWHARAAAPPPPSEPTRPYAPAAASFARPHPTRPCTGRTGTRSFPRIPARMPSSIACCTGTRPPHHRRPCNADAARGRTGTPAHDSIPVARSLDCRRRHSGFTPASLSVPLHRRPPTTCHCARTPRARCFWTPTKVTASCSSHVHATGRVRAEAPKTTASRASVPKSVSRQRGFFFFSQKLFSIALYSFAHSLSYSFRS